MEDTQYTEEIRRLRSQLNLMTNSIREEQARVIAEAYTPLMAQVAKAFQVVTELFGEDPTVMSRLQIYFDQLKLEVIGTVGQKEAYNPKYHDSWAGAEVGEPVIILSCGFKTQINEEEVVLVKAVIN